MLTHLRSRVARHTMPGMRQLKWIAFLVVPMLLASCARPLPQIVLTGPTMGTTYTVRVVDAPAEVTPATLQATIDAALNLVDELMSGYRSDSQISRFNASEQVEWVEVAPELAQVIDVATEVASASGNAFDITVGPLVDLWGFGPMHSSHIPSDEVVRSALRRVGMANLESRQAPPALRKRIPTLQVNLNAVAPGYAADLIAARFAQLGVSNCMVDVGGEIRLAGHNQHGTPWRIAVEKPVEGAPEPYAILQFTDLGVATSGEYRQFELRDGQRYSHTIDPRTGRPVQHRLASVVVVTATAAHADAWATALNVLGEEAGFELAEQLGLAAFFIIDRDGTFESRHTSAMVPYLLTDTSAQAN